MIKRRIDDKSDEAISRRNNFFAGILAAVAIVVLLYAVNS